MGNENFLLPMGQTLQTEKPNESFGMVQGRVMLFMVPIENGVTQKPVPLCEINEGKVFPAVAFRDFKGVLWQLRVKALRLTSLVFLKQPCNWRASRAHFGIIVLRKC